MRLRTDARPVLTVVAALLVAVLSLAAAPVGQSSGAAAGQPTYDEIVQALDAVRKDPNLATERTITTLRWKDGAEKKRSGTPPWMAWVAGFFAWLGQSARVLVWCTLAVLAAVLALFILRIVRTHGPAAADADLAAPTHVRDLDIRPEALPRDIGAAARTLWDAGEHRAALALLYRGLLSRLAHEHRVPIRDSTTEGDCLALASRHLGPARRDYASGVVRVWQRAVYGSEQVQSSTVYLLCDGFAAALDSSGREPASPAGSP